MKIGMESEKEIGKYKNMKSLKTHGRLNFAKWFGDNGPIIAKSFGEI